MKAAEKNKVLKSKFQSINGKVNTVAVNREAFCGAIKLKIDPIAYQKKIRNEWR